MNDAPHFPSILQDKRILITGGTGSLGKVLVRRILSGELGTPAKVIVFSRDEAKQHDMRMSYQNRSVATDETIYRNFMNILEFRIGDVRRFEDLVPAVRGADIAVNAAALKQVPACEYFPDQAVATNCLGPLNLVRAASEAPHPPETVLSVSTDKACKPVNVMGMTKAIQEKIMIAANVTNPSTRFVCVRYGNVLASRGSVIPLFHDQIRKGGPVTVTHPEMTRFLMSLDQAVDTIFAALTGAGPGETYIPTAPGAKILDVARVLVGDRPVEIRTMGIRPGEKMHEILISDEESHRTARRGAWYAVRPMLPELADRPAPASASGIPDEPAPFAGREYGSSDDLLDLEGVRSLLARNRLRLEDLEREAGAPGGAPGELLR
jgi:UDP-glucose 4-epimerase